jgi:hypothetical protein
MTLVKCPRCELNYISAKETICKVCYREIYGKMPSEETEICATCNEAPAMPGRDVCFNCRREMNKQKGIKDEPEEPLEIGMDPVSAMEEIIHDPVDEDPAFRELGDTLSLEEMSESEDKDDDEEDEDDV